MPPSTPNSPGCTTTGPSASPPACGCNAGWTWKRPGSATSITDVAGLADWRPRCQAVARAGAGSWMWVLPGLSVLAALAAGALLSSVRAGPRSPLAFQGTPDDARTLLLGITGTMITIIALLLGLAVVALQLSSTQFSPRLLRNFLRDRPNQIVLSAFVATFAYSAAGLYTVGVSGGNRTAAFPRLAVSGAIVLLFASLGLLVFFADHLLHSIQVDAI